MYLEQAGKQCLIKCKYCIAKCVKLYKTTYILLCFYFVTNLTTNECKRF